MRHNYPAHWPSIHQRKAIRYYIQGHTFEQIRKYTRQTALTTGAIIRSGARRGGFDLIRPKPNTFQEIAAWLDEMDKHDRETVNLPAI